MPAGIMLAVLSTRIGSIAGRVGSRRFLLVGPLAHGGGRPLVRPLPANSAPWKASPRRPGEARSRPSSVFIDILPYAILFGIGLAASWPR